jgi:hypothetical protein
MLYRYYSPAYDTFYANSFSEGSSISNESGLYTGLEVRPYKKWKISAFFDSYRFPWLKYLVDAPTLGKDYFVQVDYSKSRYINMFLRLKFEEKEVTQKLEEESIAQRTISHKFSSKYQLNYRVENLEFKTVMEYKLSSIEPADFGYGFSVLQDLSYEFKRLPLRVDFRYQFFDAMYYGLGSRYYVNIKYDLNENISFWAKIAQTKYSDGRELIGTANEEILGNKKTDIRLLLRWKL